MKKIKIGIDINEVLRNRWLVFDKYYCKEFGTEGAPLEDKYVFDFFKEYSWKEKKEIIKELKEPDEIPENISPLDYKIDKNTGEAPIDFILFKKSEEKILSPKDVYERFMYEDYAFEIFASAPIMYKNMDVDVNRFFMKYKKDVEFILMSEENERSIPFTLFFLSKMPCKYNNYRFVEESREMWKHCDILITTNPELLDNVPWNKNVIKIDRPYNQSIKKSYMTVLHLKELEDNPKFEKIIK